MMDDVSFFQRKDKRNSMRKEMNKTVVSTVIGAFLLSAPIAFASDKTPVDPAAKEPVKAETVAPVKQSKVVKSSATSPDAAKEAVKSAPATPDKAVSEKPAKNVSGSAAPAGDAVKTKTKHVKKTQKPKPLETTSLDVKTGHSAKAATN